MGGWGLFDCNGTISYNLEKDPYDKILATWTTGLSQWQNPALPSNCCLMSDIIAGLKQSAVDAATAQR